MLATALRAFQLLLTSACRFSHFRSRKVEATRRTMRNDPKLANEDKYYEAFSHYSGGLEAGLEAGLDSLTCTSRLFHVVGNGLGVRN
jgi:hypothetical protein